MGGILQVLSAVVAVSGIVSMGLAVKQAERGAKRLSLAFYIGSIGLIVLAAFLAVKGIDKP